MTDVQFKQSNQFYYIFYTLLLHFIGEFHPSLKKSDTLAYTHSHIINQSFYMK